MPRQRNTQTEGVNDIHEEPAVAEHDTVARQEEPLVVDNTHKENKGLGLGWLPLLLLPLLVLGLLFLPYGQNNKNTSDTQTFRETDTQRDSMNGRPEVGVGGSTEEELTPTITPVPSRELEPTLSPIEKITPEQSF